MSFDIPKWTPFTPGFAPDLPVPVGEPGRVVGLISTEGAIRRGWAAEVACGLAEAWSARGLRIVLADAGLDHPTLHVELSIPNDEGLCDALLWGASVKRVARAVRERGFYVVTAGTPVADAQAAFSGKRWGQLCDGFRQSGVNLALLVPAHETSVASVLARATDVILLATPDEDVATIAWDVLGMVRGVVGPESGIPFDLGVVDFPPAEPEGPDKAWGEAVTDAMAGLARRSAQEPSEAEETSGDGPEAEEASAGGEEAEEPTAPGDAPEGGAGKRTTSVAPGQKVEKSPTEEGALPAGPARAAAGPDAVERGMLADEVDLPPSPPSDVRRSREVREPRPDRPSGRRRNVLLLVLLLVIVGTAVAARVGYVDIPGITPAQSDASPAPVEPAPESVEAQAPPPAPTEVSALLGYSLAIASYRDQAEARGRAVTLSRLVPDVLFTVVPVQVSGTLYHRILVGPATDSVHATELATHVAERTGMDPSRWVIRATSGAFDLGQTADRAVAEERARDLYDAGMPVYVLAVDYSDGSTLYRIYAGAYADEQEAAHLSSVLAEQGLGLYPFSHRTGRLPE
jgi:hypothetical protein